MKLLILGALMMVLALLLLMPPAADKVVFLDVGQGDAILLQHGTRQVLVDGGPGRTLLTRLGEELPWFDRTIEIVILTHPQRDHVEGLLHLLEVYDVSLVLLPKVAARSGLQEAWLKSLEDSLVPYRFAWQGQEIKLGELRFQVLGPTDDDPNQAAWAEDINNASILTRVDFYSLSLLLTGDAEATVERSLVVREGERLNVDIFKAGHHGSNTSSTTTLLQAASPALVAISVGKDNSYGHPHPKVLERLNGIPVVRTDQRGSIRLVRTSGKWWLSCGNRSNWTPWKYSVSCI